MTQDTPLPADAAVRLRTMLEAMPIFQTLGLQLGGITLGEVVVELPTQPGLCFRPDQLQATAVFAAADFAAVAAAATTQPDAATSTTDTTLKLVAPANGVRLRAVGRVVQAGTRSTVCQAEVLSIDAAGEARLCATMLATAHHARTPPAVPA